MALQLQLEKENYRQWVKAGLGFGYLKEGLVPFCNDIADQQHKDILQNIRSTKSLPSTAMCGSCQVDTLKPDHKPAGNAGNKVCPFGQVRCSCCFTKGKTECRNKICGAIYDYIVQHHASSPPSPNWKNSDAQQWSIDPWSICKCFINAPGYEQKQSASETDCTGLLHLIINNQYFHNHIACNVTGTNNLFSKVRQYRNDIFHSSSLELKESEANSYIDDMIGVLQDGKELFQRSDAQIAVKKLQDLKEKDFIITTEGFEEILRQIKEEMKNAPTKEENEELKNKLEAQISKLKEEIKILKEEDSTQQKQQLEYEKAKSEWRKKLIEQYNKTLLQVPTTLLQPKSKKCSFNEIYIRPQIMREMEGEKEEIKEVKIETMSEMFTKNGVPQKSVYVLGDAGSGKTSFCKYLVNCWCLAHSEQHEADNENEEHGGRNEKHGGDNKEHVDDNEEHVGDNEEQRGDNEEHGGDNEGNGGDNEKHVGDDEEHGGYNEEHVGDNEEHVHDNEEQRGDNEEHGGDNEEHGGYNEEYVHDNEEHVGYNEEHVHDNEEHGGDNEEHGGYNEEYVHDNEEHAHDYEKHGGDNEELGGYNEEHVGDNEEHGGDNDKHGDGNENEEVNKELGGDIENERHLGDMKEHGSYGHDIQDRCYKLTLFKCKSDESTLIKFDSGEFTLFKFDSDGYAHESKSYEEVNEELGGDIENERHMGGIKEHGSYHYVIQDKSGEFTLFELDSDDYEYDSKSNEFKFNGIKGMKIGDNEEHGGGNDKHGGDNEEHGEDYEYDSKSYELKFNGVKEMKRFDFIFYIPLRQYQNIDTIDEILQKRYQMKMLNTILEEESYRVLILLDGLDEWSSEHVPEHGIFKEYTIVTTSRPWKFHTLRSSDVQIEQTLKLKGFDYKCEREMVNRTVSQLNVRRHANKEARDCREKLKEESLESFKQVPIMLQQLICLWFDGKLDKTSRCAIYTSMLELFFAWNDMKTTGTSTRLVTGTQKVILPQYLADKTKLRLNSNFIYEVSKLAFETLFNCPKNKSLTFDICMFDELEISDEVRENCLKLGIITEDECPNLSVSEPPSSLYTFFHKSMQEFLAAVYIGINFNTKFNEVFQKFSAVDDILEQSNVVIMLCGLEPRLATPVSKYIYDTVSENSHVQEYRRTLSSYCDEVNRCITDVQKLLFDVIEELNATCSVGSTPMFYIGDLIINIFNQYCCDIVCSSIEQHQFVPDSVVSINVYINTENIKFAKYLPMFNHLEKIAITFQPESPQMFIITESDSDSGTQGNEQTIDEINNCVSEINNCVSETIKVNTLTLKSLSLDNSSSTAEYNPVYKIVFSYLPSMVNLVVIKMSCITMSHDDATTFCNFLERTSHLEQIDLSYVNCECEQHDVNLSKHQQLHYLRLDCTVRLIDVDTTNLEIFIFVNLKDSNFEKIFDIIKESYKLKELTLYGDLNSKSNFITGRLVRVLPLLHNLSMLRLSRCRLTDNIIQLPLEMKSLKNIELKSVIMSLTTWRKFVDSLPPIPHAVNVIVVEGYITGDGEFNDDMLTHTSQRLKGEKGNDAIQYVKDKNQFFHVKLDGIIPVEFSTNW